MMPITARCEGPEMNKDDWIGLARLARSSAEQSLREEAYWLQLVLDEGDQPNVTADLSETADTVNPAHGVRKRVIRLTIQAGG